MIGRIVFDEAGRLLEVILGDDGRWTCDGSPEVADELNREYGPGERVGHLWGHDVLISAARRFRGLAWLGPGRSPIPADSPSSQ